MFSFFHPFTSLENKATAKQTFLCPKSSLSSIPQSFTKTGTFPFQSFSVIVLLQWWMVHREKDAGGTKINHTMLVSFVECFSSAEFSVSFNKRSPNVKDFLHWVYAGPVAPKRSFVAVMIEKSQSKTSDQFTIGFIVKGDQLWRETSTELFRQVLLATLSVFTHSEETRAFCTFPSTCPEMEMTPSGP